MVLENLLILQQKLDNIALRKEFISDFLVEMILLKMVLLNVQMFFFFFLRQTLFN